MSLQYDFFAKRQEFWKEYESKGRIDLDDFMDQYSISKQKLVSSGLFKMCEFISTADLYDFELTQKGKKYFISIRYQLFFIKTRVNPEDLYKYILKSCANKKR